MSNITSIEWTDATWNPITGCNPCSIGCDNCYAERLAKRLKAMGNPRYIQGFNVVCHDDLVDLPLKWKKPKMIFVNSMSDIFHEDVSDEFIIRLFDTMRKADWHTFQVLTKRPQRLATLHNKLKWAPNIWFGVTIESQEYISRAVWLKKSGAFIKFISFEPLLTEIVDFDIKGVDWIIVGGESGPRSRKIDVSWVQTLRDLAVRNDVPFFFKQWGGRNKKKAGKLLDGIVWNQFPYIAN